MALPERPRMTMPHSRARVVMLILAASTSFSTLTCLWRYWSLMSTSK